MCQLFEFYIQRRYTGCAIKHHTLVLIAPAMNKDYYKILGVNKTASKDEIKKAYRKLAHKYHPDKTGGDDERFKEASEAYSVLSDDKKRQEYDAYGRVFSGGGGASGAGWQDFDFSQFTGDNAWSDVDLSDLFGDLGDIFGGGRTHTKRGRDISLDIEIDFKNSVFGTKRTVLLTKNAACSTCSGSGAEPGSKMTTCDLCKGSGSLHDTKKTIFGTFTHTAACTKCRGKGKIPEEFCNVCGGDGIVRKEEEINVNVPAGINDGEMIRMTGAGEAVAGGRAGDLYVRVHVKNKTGFRKQGTSLVTDLYIKVTDAMLGATYKVETLDGKLDVKIPAGVTHGELLRVKGKGVPEVGGGRGDLLIKVHITMPSKLSRKAKKLIEELKNEGL